MVLELGAIPLLILGARVAGEDDVSVGSGCLWQSCPVEVEVDVDFNMGQDIRRLRKEGGASNELVVRARDQSVIREAGDYRKLS